MPATDAFRTPAIATNPRPPQFLGHALAPARPGTVARHAGGQGGGRGARRGRQRTRTVGTTRDWPGAARDLPGDTLLPSLSHSPPRLLQAKGKAAAAQTGCT